MQNDYHQSISQRGFVHSANIGIVITVSNIVLNLTLLILIVARRSTRSQFVYQQVIFFLCKCLGLSLIILYSV